MLTKADVARELELRDQLVAAAERTAAKRARRRAFVARLLGRGWWLVAVVALGLLVSLVAGCDHEGPTPKSAPSTVAVSIIDAVSVTR